MNLQVRSREYLHENLPRVERCVEDFKANYGHLPGLVVLESAGERIHALDALAIDKMLGDSRLPSNLRAALRDIKQRVYEDDVPIIVEVPGNVMRTSLETFKVRLEVEAAGGIVIGIGGAFSGAASRAQAPRNRFKRRDKRHR